MTAKRIWIKADPWDKDTVTSALEAGADAVWVPEGYSDKVRELGLIQTVAPDGDLKLGRDVIEIAVGSKSDEEAAARAAKSAVVVVHAEDWSIIPLENLIASGGTYFAAVADIESLTTALGVLEKGVDGVLYAPSSPTEIARAVRVVRGTGGRIELETARIRAVKPVGMGDRVCIDTCTNMVPGQGALVGNTSKFMFLVHAETVENPYVEPRPFRINAGGVHAYVMAPGGRTRYLSELAIGDEVLIVDREGVTEVAVVGRTKTEKRPMLLVTAEVHGLESSLILQNAETIRLTAPDGRPLSVVGLGPGDEVLVHTETAARHFGMAIEESISEK